ncbi:MAG: hypothetical protein ACYC0F_12335 [Rhodanobacter sp.]
MSRFVFASAMLLACCSASTVLLAQSPPATPSSVGSSRHQPVPRTAGPNDRHCIRNTGSRIPVKEGHCLPVIGRSYSQQDLQRTGQTDLGSALQQLDPSITVGGH